MARLFKDPSDRVLVFVVVLMVGLVAVVLWIFGQRIDNLNYSVNNLGTFPLKTYVQTGLQGYFVNGVVAEPKEKRVYIPELNIYLPLSQLTRDLMYNYSAAETGADPKQPQELNLTTKSVLSKYYGSFDQVPCQQRLVGISVGSIDPDMQKSYGKLSGTLALKDKRTLYFYQSTAAGCEDMWGSEALPSAVVGALKQAQSY